VGLAAARRRAETDLPYELEISAAPNSPKSMRDCATAPICASDDPGSDVYICEVMMCEQFTKQMKVEQ
jgi:hypothetical protein